MLLSKPIQLSHAKMKDLFSEPKISILEQEGL